MDDFVTGFHKRKVKRRKFGERRTKEEEKARLRAERARRARARSQVPPTPCAPPPRYDSQLSGMCDVGGVFAAKGFRKGRAKG